MCLVLEGCAGEEGCDRRVTNYVLLYDYLRVYMHTVMYILVSGIDVHTD